MNFSKRELEENTERQKRLHEKLKSTPKKGIIVEWNGLKFHVSKNVFRPHPDSIELSKRIKIKKESKVLDVGTGAGTLAVFAALKGAIVTAVDINQAAVKCAKKNAKLFRVSKRMNVLKSDVFSALKKGLKFDVITANLPFCNRKAKNIVEASTWDTGLRANKKLLKGLKERLEENGRLYLVQANFGAIDEIKKLAEKYKLRIKKLGERKYVHKQKFYALEITVKK